MKHGLALLISVWACACGYDPIDGSSMVGDGGVVSDGPNDAFADDDAGDNDAMTTSDAGVCDDAIRLPASISEDTTVGPGCVRILATSVTNGATLTIAAGTRVLMEPGGFLEVSTFRTGNAALIAIGTDVAPIVFTSSSASPSAGDWGCVHITGTSTVTEIQHVTFEHGGETCDVGGGTHDGMLQVDAVARAVSNNTFRHSVSHGVSILRNGGVRDFSNNTFQNNQRAGIRVSSRQLLTLGSGHTFADVDDHIEVETSDLLTTTGIWRAQPVPFRMMGTLDIRSGAVITVAAGVTAQMTGGSIELTSANLIVEGTAEDPVVFTSANAVPTKGDWGCIGFLGSDQAPRFRHAIFEYGGNGTDCGSVSARTALNAPTNAVVDDCTFRQIAGSAIRSTIDCDVAGWCDNTFEGVDMGPLSCSGDPIACP